MAARHVWTLAAVVLVACNMDGDVGHRGSYAFLPDGDVPDTAARPLRKLLIVDEDAASATRLYYYFEGDLGRLGLGVQALPRVLLREGRLAYAFDPPLATYTAESSDGGAGGESGEDDVPPGSLILDANGTTVALRPLAAADLTRTGTTRFTSALEDGGATARAFFGVEAEAVPLGSFTLPDDGAAPEEPLTFTPEIASAAVELSLDGDRLAVDRGALRDPDYLVIDLFQDIERISYVQKLEAILRITIRKDTRYLASPQVLSAAYPSLCWSVDEPLFARVTQVARAYRSFASGDVAIIHRLANVSEVAPELWTPAIQASAQASFCADFR